MPRTATTEPRHNIRSYVSEFTLTFQMMSIVGKLIKITKPSVEDVRRFVSVCPDCETPAGVTQQYVCNIDKTHTHPMAELDRAKDIGDGELVRVNQEDIAEARTSDLPLNVFNATIHPTKDVLDVTWDSDNAYVFMPAVRNPGYELFVRLVKDSGVAFVAMCNLRNNEGLFRLDIWRGNLVVQKLLWPADCNAIEPAENTCPDLVFEANAARLRNLTEPFEADVYRSSVKERLAALQEQLATGVSVPKKRVEKPAESWDDLLNAFG